MLRGIFPARTFVIVATHYVVPPARFGELPFTEIVAGASHDVDAARQIFVTRDEAIAARAISLEGSDARVTVNWHCVQVPRGIRRVVDALEEWRPLEAIA